MKGGAMEGMDRYARDMYSSSKGAHDLWVSLPKGTTAGQPQSEVQGHNMEMGMYGKLTSNRTGLMAYLTELSYLYPISYPGEE